MRQMNKTSNLEFKKLKEVLQISRMNKMLVDKLSANVSSHCN